MLLKDHPVFSEIQLSDNPGVNLNILTTGSSKSLIWTCNQGHKWENEIRYRSRSTNPRGCPVCSGKTILPGFNDLFTTHPELSSELKNKEEAFVLSKGTHRKTFWVCDLGHEWEASVSNRVNGSGCPVCVSTQILPLNQTHPELCKELLNKEEAHTLSRGSNVKTLWVCGKGHEWESSPKLRTSGRGCPVCSGRKILVGVNDLGTVYPESKTLWSDANIKTVQDYTKGSQQIVLWKCLENDSHEDWRARINDVTLKGSRCPTCSYGRRSSKAEKTIFEYCQSLLPDEKIYTSYRSLIQGELDVYIPSRNIAIEFNGVYWHNESYVGKNYHYDKWLACKNKNVQLIQIWEDDWNRNQVLIKNMIAHKLGVTSQGTVYARQTKIISLTNGEARDFLNAYHIQGSVDGSYRLGLSDMEGNVVAVMVLKKESGTQLNLLRFATSKLVVGGFSKLLSYVDKILNFKSVVTFSDNTVSTGNLYLTHGFVEDKILPPDYMYVVSGAREHKFNYRLKRFKNDSSLQYVEGLTEKDLAELNNLPRIWDAGKIRWVKTFMV